MFAFRAVPGTGGAVGFAAAPECSEVVRWSGLPRDVYCPEISTKSALFPWFGHKANALPSEAVPDRGPLWECGGEVEVRE